MVIWRLLKRRVVVATLGALLIGSASGLYAGAQLIPSAGSNGQLASAASTRSAAPGGAVSTSTATASALPTATDAPTATSAPTPRPTPTVPVPGTSGRISGTIISNPANDTFTLQTVSATYSIVANSNTTVTINGVQSTFSALTQGMRASVRGVWSTSGTLAATSISVSQDN